MRGAGRDLERSEPGNQSAARGLGRAGVKGTSGPPSDQGGCPEGTEGQCGHEEGPPTPICPLPQPGSPPVPAFELPAEPPAEALLSGLGGLAAPPHTHRGPAWSPANTSRALWLGGCEGLGWALCAEHCDGRCQASGGAGTPGLRPAVGNPAVGAWELWGSGCEWP